MSAAVPGGIWLIGCGNMGGAMLRRWVDSGIGAEQIVVIDPGAPTVPPGVAVVASPPPGALPGIVVLAIKPQQLAAFAATHGARFAGVPLLVSILAGVEEAVLAAYFAPQAVVRAMPNLPVAIGKGVVALHSETEDAGLRAAAGQVMAPLGLVEWIASEPLFDAVTALSGCGPGFVYRFIDAIAEAGASLGLPVDQARRLALATVEGSALLAAQADAPPAVLADRVASPGGSTREGLNVLDRDGALAALMRETLSASARRNAEMAAEARK